MSRIAKIVASNSHVDYVARVVDELDAEEPPAPSDYGFAQFVRVPVAEGQEVVGVVYDSRLANPDYGSFGPRLSSPTELRVLSPDVLNERGVLLGILLLGWREREGGRWVGRQAVPRRVVPVGQDVFGLSDGDVAEFHRGEDGSVRLHYFSQAIAHAGAFATPLVESVIEQLEPACSAAERQRLCVLKKSLVWQRTLGAVRL
ncbi:MAG TPA: hypothetical protein VM936_00835 [Pyrinomonadaceae bacterium]|jgi:hypothetical protein|nr:hypothetical protein [Pyrinomonadaceae bacterium]